MDKETKAQSAWVGDRPATQQIEAGPLTFNLLIQQLLHRTLSILFLKDLVSGNGKSWENTNMSFGKLLPRY